MGLPPPTIVQSVSLFKVGTECEWCGEVFEGDGTRSNEDMYRIYFLVFAGLPMYPYILCSLSRKAS